MDHAEQINHRYQNQGAAQPAQTPKAPRPSNDFDPIEFVAVDSGTNQQNGPLSAPMNNFQ